MSFAEQYASFTPSGGAESAINTAVGLTGGVGAAGYSPTLSAVNPVNAPGLSVIGGSAAAINAPAVMNNADNLYSQSGGRRKRKKAKRSRKLKRSNKSRLNSRSKKSRSKSVRKSKVRKSLSKRRVSLKRKSNKNRKRKSLK